MLDVGREDIVEGPLARTLVVLSLPLAAQNLVQVANQVVDVFWLGRLSEAAVAGVGFVIPIIGVLFAALFAAFVGTHVVVSQRVGDDDLAGARRGTFNGSLLALGLGVAIGGAVALAAGALVRPFLSDPEVAAFAVAYLATYAMGLPVLFVADTVEAGLVGVGDSRGSFYLNSIAVGINILLDPVLIFGLGPVPAFGVRGAAFATIIGYAVGLVLAIALVVRGRYGLVVTREALTVDPGDLREIVGVGLPNSGQILGQQSARIVMVGIVSVVGGPAGLAAYTVGARIASVAFIPAQGLQQAAQSVVGQNLGASQPDRAERATWLGVGIAVVGLGAVGAVQWAIPGPLVAVFLPEATPLSAGLTADYLRILAYGYPAIGATYLLFAGFNAARRTRTSMLATLLQYWGVRLPIAAVGAFVLALGVHAVFWAVTLSNVAAAVGVGSYYRYRTGLGMLGRATERFAAQE